MACELKNNAAVQAFAEGNSQLTATLHAVLKKENPGNLIFSPFSLGAVVAMAHLGANNNFSNNAASAAETNNCVEKITNNKIKELISADALNSLTGVVLVIGVYFKGQWKNKFDEEPTEKQPFHLNENDTVEVDMMYKQAKFPYAYFEDHLHNNFIQGLSV